MRVPSTRDLLDLWDAGHGRDHTTRALLMLDAARVAPEDRTGADLTIGERDRRLIDLRRAMFGPLIEAVERCPSCEARLEITFDLSTLLAEEPNDSSEPLSLDIDGYHMTLRAPTSQDLLIATAPGSTESSYNRLLERCVIDVAHETLHTSAGALPEHIRGAVAQAIATHDALAVVTLNALCEECDESWETAFDIVEFLWDELAALARRTLRDVHILARGYGWTEQAILSLPHRRRAHYLGMVTNG